MLQYFRASKAPEAKAVPRPRMVAGTGRVAWSPRDATSLTRSGFAGNPVGYRAVKMIAEAAASVPLLLQDHDRRFSDHPILRLLARPNPAQGGQELLEHLFGQLLLTGNAYLEAAGTEVPVALHILRSDRMSVVAGRDGWPAAYEYKVGQAVQRWDVVDGVSAVLHVKSFHPQDDHYGLSPMQAAAAALDVHGAASRWSKALLDNAARPSGAIVYRGGDGTLAPDQYSRLLDELETNHQGARNAGRPMLLEGGLDWQPMGFSPSDMEFQETRAAAARDIALAFGVPPMLLGLPGDATYANYQEANRAFYRLTVLPLVGKVAGALSNWLPGFFQEDLRLVADLDAIPALATEREAQWRRVANASFLTDQEKRRLLGLPVETTDA